MSETKVPAIPAVTDNNVRDVARIFKMILDVREGRAGDPLDANVTYRDLILAGALKLRPGWNPNSSLTPVLPAVVGDDGYNPEADLNLPPAPTGLVISTGIALTKLRWDAATYRNHAYTEVWRSSTNVLGDAILIGTSDTRYYVDALGETGVVYYYWVRHVSQANVTSPYNATNGTQGLPGLVDNIDVAFLDAAKITTGFLSADRIQAGTLDAKIVNIDAAVIQSGTIASARIADGSITNAKIGDFIQSSNYVAGSAGWQINKNGNAEFQNATVRGVIRSSDNLFVIDTINKFISISV